jgi:Tol biopolymer transport system component
MSADGKKIVFVTASDINAQDQNGLSDVYLYDVDTQQTQLLTKNSSGNAFNGNSDKALISKN